MKKMNHDMDTTGGEPEDAYTFNFTVDSLPPVAPVISSHDISITHKLASDKVTLKGTREANTEVWLNNTKVVSLGSTDWSIANHSLVQGDNTLTLKLKDAAGNESPTTTLNVEVDSNAPVISASTLTGFVNSIPNESISVKYLLNSDSFVIP